MSDEQNIIIAKWMGWKFDERWGCLVPPDHTGPDEMFTLYNVIDDDDDDDENWYLSRKLINKNWRGGIKRTGNGRPIIPEFSTDLNAMVLALKVVKERGLDNKYAYYLLGYMLEEGGPVKPYKTSSEWYLMEEEIFLIATATANEQVQVLCQLIAQEKE